MAVCSQLGSICGEMRHLAMTTCIPRIAFDLFRCFGLAGVLALGGCPDDEPGSDNESEVITTVRLTFTPPGGGEPVVAAFSDPDGDGGMSGASDPIALALGTTYDLDVAFLDELQEPAEDITREVQEEAEEHQVFVTGTAVEGPGSVASPIAPVLHAYGDSESQYGADAVGDDLPVGLAGTITARVAGTGTLAITLRHLPELNGQPQKTADLAERLAAGEPLPGDVDAAVEFELTVVQ
jgi:hypothetical protein